MDIQPYHPGACLLCYTTSITLKLCSRCRTAYYCNITCQNANWKNHRYICKLVGHIRDSCFSFIKSLEHADYLEFKFIQFIMKQFPSLLAPNKLCNVLEMVIKSRICQTCGKYNERLETCEKCFSVFYCCKAHFNENLHYKLCKTYQLRNKYLQVMANGTILMPAIRNVDINMNLLEKDMSYFIKVHYGMKIDEEFGKIALYSEDVSSPLSLLYLINKTQYLDNDVPSNGIIIYIMTGNVLTDTLGMRQIYYPWIEFFMWFLPPCLYNANFVFITNEVTGTSSIDTSRHTTSKNKSFRMTTVSLNQLEDYHTSNAPHLIAVLKSYPNNEMAPIVKKYICKLKVPTAIISAFRNLVESVRSCIATESKSHTKVVLPLQENPYASLVPKPVALFEYKRTANSQLVNSDEGFMYQNKFITIIAFNT